MSLPRQRTSATSTGLWVQGFGPCRSPKLPHHRPLSLLAKEETAPSSSIRTWPAHPRKPRPRPTRPDLSPPPPPLATAAPASRSHQHQWPGRRAAPPPSRAPAAHPAPAGGEGRQRQCRPPHEASSSAHREEPMPAATAGRDGGGGWVAQSDYGGSQEGDAPKPGMFQTP
nr:CASP-like protein 4A2 [Lolium perenne]